MNATEIAYLEARIEEERYRKVEEAEATYRRDIEALGVVRGLYERYGTLETPEEEAVPSDEDAFEEPQAEDDRDPVEAYFGPSPQDAGPPDAAGAIEEEQRAEAGEPEPEPVASEPEEPTQPDVPEGHKLCKRCGPALGPKPLSAFGRHSSFADGRDNRCKDCRNEMRRLKKAGLPDPGPEAPTLEENGEGGVVASSGPPMRITVLPRTPMFEAEHQELLDEVASQAPKKASAEARYCANGEDCTSVKHTGKPTKLNSGNKGAVCYGCEERETAFGSRPVGTLGPLVRKSNADKATG